MNAAALFWKPQVALFVNEATLLPVLVPLAPARTLAKRFPEHLEAVLDALGTDPRFAAAEVAATVDPRWARTAKRSVVGIMNECTLLADVHRFHEHRDDVVSVAVRLAGTPCGPLYTRHSFPDQELAHSRPTDGALAPSGARADLAAFLRGGVATEVRLDIVAARLTILPATE